MKFNLKEGSKLNLKQIYSVTKEKKRNENNLKEGIKLNLKYIILSQKRKKNEL